MEIENLKIQLKKLKKQLEQEQAATSMLADINYDDLSPRKAFDLLWKIKQE